MEFIKRNPKIFIVSVKARSGKNEISKKLEKSYSNKKCITISFGYYIKDYAKRISDWDGSEETKPRELLQQLGTNVIRKKIDPLFFVDAIIKDMKVGDVSEPFESTDNEGRNGHTIYKIIKLEEIVPSHVADIEKDFELIQRIANQDLQVKAIDNFVNEKISTTYIKIDDMFKQCDWERSGWIK
ncbi:MAG: hypothetical protein J6U47_05270 [Bacteroidales bacterium]|nr:hypothetical protein [Bacteroidales bacterium]